MGVPLAELKTSDEIKHIIAEFEKYSQFSAYQIATMTLAVDSDNAVMLRQTKRQYRREQKENPDTAVAFVVKQHIAGVTYKDIQKRFAHSDAINRGKLFLRMVKAGSNALEIAKAVKLPIQNVESILRSTKIEVKV